MHASDQAHEILDSSEKVNGVLLRMWDSLKGIHGELGEDADFVFNKWIKLGQTVTATYEETTTGGSGTYFHEIRAHLEFSEPTGPSRVISK